MGPEEEKKNIMKQIKYSFLLIVHQFLLHFQTQNFIYDKFKS